LKIIKQVKMKIAVVPVMVSEKKSCCGLSVLDAFGLDIEKVPLK